jgi:hypothetical protein
LTFSEPQFVIDLEIWRVFGEYGLKDATFNDIYCNKISEWLNDSYEKSPARLCLNFYDILIRQYIYDCLISGKSPSKSQKPFIYEYYLYLICEKVTTRLDDISDSYAERFYEDLKYIIYLLLEVQVKFQCTIFVTQLLNIFESLLSNAKFDLKRKAILAKWIIESYLQLSEIESQAEKIDDTLDIAYNGIESKNSKWFKIAIDSIDKMKYSSYTKYDEIVERIKQLP